MSDLGHLPRIGALSAQNRVTPGAWVVTFDPQLMPRQDFEVWHGSALGPGGYFLIYRDDVLYGTAENGRINEYSPTIAMFVKTGQTITCHWSIATGTAPTVTLFFRTPEVGRV